MAHAFANTPRVMLVAAICWTASVSLLAAAQPPSCAAEIQNEIRKRFPSDRYVIGRGIATATNAPDGQRKSQQAALAQVGVQLESKVDYELVLRSEQSSDRRAYQSAMGSTRATSSMALKNVHFELECYDDEKHEYRTLAVLDRAEAMASARAALEQINADGRALQLRASDALRARRLGEAGKATLALRDLVVNAQPHLQVLRALGAPEASSFLDLSGLRHFEQEVIDGATTFVAMDDPAKSAIESELGRHRFPVAKTRDSAAFEVKGRIANVLVGRSEMTGMTIVELTADVVVSYAGAPESIDTFQVIERNGGISEADATRVASLRLAAQLGPRVSKSLVKHVGLLE